MQETVKGIDLKLPRAGNLIEVQKLDTEALLAGISQM